MMDENQQLLLLLQTQQKMSDDIADIKATIKEAAQILIFLRRDHDEFKTETRNRLSQLEKAHLECPARLKMQGWALSLRDVLWLVCAVASVLSVWYTLKR
jgi:hypothetical protein